MKTYFILHTFRRPVRAPQWWEGHTICYKQYPLKGGIGLWTLNLSARDGGRQQRPPYDIAQDVTVIVGGKQMRGQVYSIEIHTPGWEQDRFDPKDGQWLVTVCFPRIPKDHLRLP